MMRTAPSLVQLRPEAVSVRVCTEHRLAFGLLRDSFRVPEQPAIADVTERSRLAIATLQVPFD
ncbi:hypothetical protein BTO02_32700 [Paraburkholderia sp. SOS3]|nr:hypothetical protein BTO02_32700 [Paraburkholderia sp. SOS3]